jgi:hypothetical protein
MEAVHMPRFRPGQNRGIFQIFFGKIFPEQKLYILYTYGKVGE